jgi:tetrathionate reductase subunit A
MNDQRTDLARRRFLKHGAFLGGGLLASTLAGERAAAATQSAILGNDRPDVPYEYGDAEHLVHSVCQNCNTGCGVKVKIQDGLAAKIDGNPYSPWTMVPHLPMTSSLDEAAKVDGAICPKGQAAVQTVYDPYRIRRVLKRAGRRGEGRWVSIPFDQAISEIVEGGRLFADVPGEEAREVEGLRSIMALRDDAVAKAMAADVRKVLDEKDPAAKRALVDAFKVTHAANLDLLIDPDHPDLGPRNNQFVMAWGRMKGGRGDFMKRFGSGFGTTNLHGHTTVCQGSLYFTCKAISEQYEAGKFTGGQKFYWQADTENARYILFVGANLFEANYGPTNRTVRLTDNLATRRTRIAVVDPRFSKLASKADTWLPIKPGEDAALALAITRWMIDNEAYDTTFLRGANKAAARANGETSWTNASWLVEIKDGKPGKFARAADLGVVPAETRTIPDPANPDKSIEYVEKFFVALRDGQPVPVDPNDTETPVDGDLFVDTIIGGVHVKSGLQLLAESARTHTIAEWCDIAGVSPEDTIKVARELAAAGKQGVVDIHRGPAQHTNGFYNVLAWMSVNMLLGNFDWKGGLAKATTYNYDGTKGGVANLTKVPGKITTFGVSSIRHDLAYEKSTLFDGYPAKRNWYPLSSDVYEEIVPSIGEAYPYPVKALFLYMGTPVYALPAGHTNIEVLADVERLPLFFASDVTVGTSTMYADYIFPDLTWLERWEFHGSHPNMPNKVQPVRQPAAAPIPESCVVYGEEMPISFESLLMGLAEKLGLAAFGPDALGEGLDLRRPEEFYLRAIANLAAGEKPDLEDAVPAADPRELEIFARARAHLPASVYDEQTWRRIVGDDLWPRVVYVLNRGGRFEEHARGYDGDRLRHTYGKLLCLYQEKTAGVIHSGTGEPLPGLAVYLPQRDYGGNELGALAEGHDLALITHRTITQTKSRTIGNYWLTPILPENAILMNPADATRLGLRDNQQIRVVSATNPEGVWDLKNGRTKDMVGKLRLTETLRPGVVSFVLGFGHWATGAADIVVDGDVVPGDPRRARGIHANAAMWTDPALRGTTCLLDPVGGSVSFYDTKVRIIPA